MKNKTLIRMLPFIIILLGVSIFLVIDLLMVDTIEANVQADMQVTKKNFEMIPFFWVVGIIGGCIGLTLAYVSWRKYQAEKKKQQKKNPNR